MTRAAAEKVMQEFLVAGASFNEAVRIVQTKPTARLFFNYTYSLLVHNHSCHGMRRTSLTKPELEILEVLWARGACSVRELHEALPAKGRPAFTTVQTVVYRLEKKEAVRCVKRISKANIFEAAITRDQAHTTLVDELLNLFGGRPKPVMARLVESGRLTLEDIKEAEDALKKLLKKGGSR